MRYFLTARRLSTASIRKIADDQFGHLRVLGFSTPIRTLLWSLFCSSVSAVLLIFLVLSPAIASAAGEGRRVSVEWEEVPGTTAYDVEFVKLSGDVSSGKKFEFQVKSAAWQGNLPAGKYTMRIRSYDERKVPGEWGAPEPFAVMLKAPQLLLPAADSKVQSSESEKQEVQFQWQPMDGAKSYKIEIQPGDIKEVIESTSFNLKLPVAKQYQWKVTSFDSAGNEGEAGLEQKFFLVGPKLTQPKIAAPDTKFVRELSWDKPDFAQKYNLEISRQQPDKTWKVVDRKKAITEERVDFAGQYPGGHYRARLQAKAELRGQSEVHSIEFDVQDGDRSPAAEKTSMLRESIETPKRNLFLASYLLTQMNYSGRNAEVGQTVGFDAVGGSGRLGYGRTIENSRWSYLGILDLSGLTIGKRNLTFASSELHAAFKTFLGSTQLRASGGLFYKELPETKGEIGISLAPETAQVSTVASVGPHVGFDLWKPFTLKYGLQLNSRVYYNYFGVKTPNGKALLPTTSYQFGFMGSYRFNSSTMGFLGYAYRQDQLSYMATPGTNDVNFTSLAAEGEVNTVTIQGHYLNAVLEWGF